MSSQQKIFRQAALDRLASPEQVDRPLNLISDLAWIALFVIVAMLGVFLAWSVYATAPIKVPARGLIIASGGLSQIVSDSQGRILSLGIQQGDVIRKGDVVATFAQSELERELETARASHEDAQQRFLQLSTFYRENSQLEQSLESDRIDAIRQTRELLQDRLVLVEQKLRAINRLINERVVIEQGQLQAQLDLANVHERLAELDNEEKSIALRNQERLSEQSLSLLDAELQVKQLQRTVQRLHARLTEQQTLKSPHTGRVVEVIASPGDVLSSSQPIATVAPVDDRNSSLVALLYVDPVDGKKVREGMTTEVVPAAFRPEQFGYMLGTVEQVSELPATLAGMRRILKNDQLARDLTQAGAPFEVRVRLNPSADTRSGYRWSSSNGPDAEINTGMLLSAQVIVNKERLLNLFVPFVDRVIQ